MCRKNLLISAALMGLGVGLAIGCRAESSFWCTCFGLGFVLFGITIIQKGKM